MRRIKIILIVLIISIFGCSDDDTSFFYELIPIQNVVLPDYFKKGETHKVIVSYYKSTNCHYFSGFDYNKSSNKRAVSVVNLKIDKKECKDIETKDLIEVSFNFFVGKEKSYIFKFWQGRDKNGNHTFLTVEVPVK
ncbi:hypothetical protein [Aquimarina longa]|uniref:hypothetical protein n=1 Tax=Aquimarina longa TaxID=1080221 RepID=UPI000780FC46|nr:hypothetical protein [Aquimarina longa]